MSYTEIIQTLYEKHKSPLRTAQLLEAQIPYTQVIAMEKRGELIRIKNGYYLPKGEILNEEELVSRLFPDGVFTMETALYYHGYLKKRSSTWQIAVSKNISKSRFKMDYPSLTSYYTEPDVLAMGVERKLTESEDTIQLYDIDRLMCEILKYEERMDPKDLQTALKKYIGDSKKNIERLVAFSKERKVSQKVKQRILPWVKQKPMEKPIEYKTKSVPIQSQAPLVTELPLLLETHTEETLSKLISALYENNPSYDCAGIIKSLESAITRQAFEGVRLLACLDKTNIKSVIKDRKNDIYDIIRQELATNIGKETVDTLTAFLLPLEEALKKDEHFMGDWMPELKRYL